MMNKNCIFCQDTKNIVYESDNFYIKIGIGIICAGHCLLISKQHLTCMGDMHKKYIDEFLNLQKKLIDFLSVNFYKPFIIEHGVFAQSVYHAHTHFIPLKSVDYKEISLMEDLVESFCKKQAIKCDTINHFSEVLDVYNTDKEYLYFEEDNKKLLLRTKKYQGMEDIIEQGFNYRNFFTEKIGLVGVSSWKTMTEQDKIIDEIKIKETIEKFKSF